MPRHHRVEGLETLAIGFVPDTLDRKFPALLHFEHLDNAAVPPRFIALFSSQSVDLST